MPVVSCPAELDPLGYISPRARQVVSAARELLERDGWDALTMRALGERLGIKAPSLYKHFSGKEALRATLAGVALAESGSRLHAVVAADGDIAELLAAYREQAHRNPQLYRLATSGTLPRAELPPGLEDWSGEPFFVAAGGDPHLAQALWSLAHGMTTLELDGRYPTGRAPEQTWQTAVDLFMNRRAQHPSASPRRVAPEEPPMRSPR